MAATAKMCVCGRGLALCSQCIAELIEGQKPVVQQPQPAICQVCGGNLEYYFHRFWGWVFGSCYRCVKCGRKWTDKTGPR